jgi:hypothetical protein
VWRASLDGRAAGSGKSASSLALPPALQDNVHALRAAAGAALLSADAGMGRLEPMLNIAREVLDSAMKIEA